MGKIAIASLALLTLTAAAGLSAEVPADFAAAEAVFSKAVAGNAKATGEAVERFQMLAAAESPLSPLFLAYVGSAQTLQGRDAWMPWTKMRATERGLDTLDKALRGLEPRHDRELARGAPVAIEARLVAATTFIAVPAMFNRFDLGKQTLREAFASPAYAAAPVEIKVRLHQQAAIAAARDKKPDEEAVQLRKLLDMAPSGVASDAARRRLQELGS